MDEFYRNSAHMHTYAKIMSYDTVNQIRVSSKESNITLLDAMSDDITLNTEKINELMPLTNSSSSTVTETSSVDNLSHLSLFTSHMLTSSNNAAQSIRTSSNTNKRLSLLHTLFGRSRKRTLVSTQPSKRRIISVGDQVKLSSTRLHGLTQPYSSTIHEETIDSEKNINQETQFLFPGLRYDFKQVTAVSDTKLSSKDHIALTPIASHLAFKQEKSLSSLPHLPKNEPKLLVQSAHNIAGLPKTQPNNISMGRISFNADQHKFDPQTPTYHSPKYLSTIELFAKKYRPTNALQNSTGLLWYNVNQQTIGGINLPYKRVTIYNKKNRFDVSSDSRDTSSSSNSSSASSSSSSSSSTTSSSKKTNKSRSSSSSCQSTKVTGPFNRNQNDTEAVIHIDLDSSASQTSTSTSNTSIQPCYQRFISRKQSFSISSATTITSENNSSSSSLMMIK